MRMAAVAIAVPVFLLAGCDRSPAVEMVMPEEAEGFPVVTVVPPRREPATETNDGRRIRIAKGNFKWEWSYPAAAGHIPELRRELDEYADEALGADNNMARSVARERHRTGKPIGSFRFSYVYEVVADLPLWLSLSARSVDGDPLEAHAPWPGGVLWNRALGRRIAFTELFVSEKALNCAIAGAVNRRAQQQGAERRRFLQEMRKLDRSVDPCRIDVRYSLIAGSSNGRTFDRIGVLFAPFDVRRNGRLVNRTDEITLPVTPELLAAVKPEYRDSFSLGR